MSNLSKEEYPLLETKEMANRKRELEKLNKIYQKLLDIETRIKIIEYDRELKEAEAEERNVKYKIEDIKNGSHYIREQAEEEMAMFRRIKEEE